jgi:uncharacterized protein
MSKLVRILSIDGGGIRGIIPAMILDEIERRTHKRTVDLFDVIAGTSTGGILGLAVALRGPDGQGPRFTAAEMVELYVRNGATIFPTSALRNFLSYFRGPKFPRSGIDRVLKETFGEARLSDALVDVIVPSYNIESDEPFLFSSREARRDARQDFPMWQVARATSAAPSFFAPCVIPAVDPSMPDVTLVDGGVFANNPTMCGFSMAQQWHQGEDVRFAVVSLGSGRLTHKYNHRLAGHWGLIFWAVPLLNIIFDGTSQADDLYMRNLIGEFKDPTLYYRFQGVLDEMDEHMADARPKNIQALKNVARTIIDDHDSDINAVCDLLMSEPSTVSGTEKIKLEL